MGAVTYPNPEVRSVLAASFTCFQLNMTERHPDFKEASAGRKVIWAPTFIFADSKRQEIRRFTGWLAPRHFVAELRFVLAMNEFQQTRFPEAAAAFERIVAQGAGLDIAPEAEYWRGISAFLAGKRDKQALAASWKKLAQEHPTTRWGMHAAVIEDDVE